jgi:hypothetical protein
MNPIIRDGTDFDLSAGHAGCTVASLKKLRKAQY